MSSPSYGRHQLATTGPRADADVGGRRYLLAEPPPIVIHKTHRRGLCKAALRKARLDGSYSRRTFYKADRVRGLASIRVAKCFTATPLLRECRGGRYSCLQGLLPADSNSDPHRSEWTLNLVMSAEDTNPCHDDCGEASVLANEAETAIQHADSPTPTLAIDG